MAGTGEAAWRRLVEAARAADKDHWRDASHAGIGDQSPKAREALRKLADDEDPLGSQPAESLWLLARRRKEAGDHGAAERVLRRAWRQRPDDFWVNFELARAFGTDIGASGEIFPHPEEGMRYLTAALAARPASAMAHHNLAITLSAQGKNDEAVAEWRTAIRFAPQLMSVLNQFANLLMGQGKLDLATTGLVGPCRPHAEGFNIPEPTRVWQDPERSLVRLNGFCPCDRRGGQEWIFSCTRTQLSREQRTRS